MSKLLVLHTEKGRQKFERDLKKLRILSDSLSSPGMPNRLGHEMADATVSKGTILWLKFVTFYIVVC